MADKTNKKKKKPLPEQLTYEEFLSRSKLSVKVFRPRNAEYFIAEITNAWLFENNFYLRVEGIGNTEMRAIVNLMEKILGKRIWIDIEDDSKKRYFKVPRIISFNTGFTPNVGMGDGPIFGHEKEELQNKFALALAEQNKEFIDSLKEVRENFLKDMPVMHDKKKSYNSVIKEQPPEVLSEAREITNDHLLAGGLTCDNDKNIIITEKFIEHLRNTTTANEATIKFLQQYIGKQLTLVSMKDEHSIFATIKES